MMKRVVLLVLLLLGIIHSECFGQNNQNGALLCFKASNDVLYEYYANNKSELDSVRVLIEKHTEDIVSQKGYFQLVAYLPKEERDNPAVLNKAAHCAAVVRGWMRHQSPSLAKMVCAFSFSTSDSSNVEVAVNYIAASLESNTPQAIHFSEKGNVEAIQAALSKYETLPFIASDSSREASFDKKAENTPQQALAAANTRQPSPSVETHNTITIIPDFILYFRVDKSNIDSTYMNNAAVLERMNRIVTERNIAYIDSLIISAYASPEAPSAYNKRLSERRANAVRDYFLKRFSLLEPDIVHAYGYGENWDGLRKLAAADSLLPMQDEVLRIIDSNLSEDEREGRLKVLQRGAVYRYIYNNFYPRLRLGASLNVMLTETAPEDLRALISVPTIQQLVIRIDPLQRPLPPITIHPLKPSQPITYSYPLAFRTNLLYDAVGALNIGVEVPYGKKKNWSVSADIAYSYWRSSKNLYAFQTLEYGLENRYWFGVNKERKERKPNWAQPLKGFYIGVYGNYWQRYDVQFIDGYQGDAAWSAGLTAGYVVPLNRSLSFDFGIGVGWFSTSEYRHYHRPEYDEHGKYHLMWQQTGSWSGFSLTKLRFALVWMIQTNKTQKKRDKR